MAGSFSFYEFFAGGGLARAGLGAGWRCDFANDFDPAKAAAYRLAWGGDHLAVGDIGALLPADLPGRADLAWASSPCQDVSLAGARRGLAGARSGAVWRWLELMNALDREGRAPAVLVLENVTGLLTSSGGADLRALLAELARQGRRIGALEVDAAGWTPQSRPRLFLIAARGGPSPLAGAGPAEPFHTRRVREAHAALPPELQAAWAWWRLPPPAARNTALVDVLEPDAPWDAAERTARLTALLGPLHAARLEVERRASALHPGLRAGALYRRTRVEDGQRVQRAELRFDGLAGCLRTPGGGSSRQVVVGVEAGAVRTRRLRPREAARLMGLADDHPLPTGDTAALQLLGDGVSAPAVRWLAAHLLEPLAQGAGAGREAA